MREALKRKCVLCLSLATMFSAASKVVIFAGVKARHARIILIDPATLMRSRTAGIDEGLSGACGLGVAS